MQQIFLVEKSIVKLDKGEKKEGKGNSDFL